MATTETKLVAETELPEELSVFQAVDAAYPDEIAGSFTALRRKLSVLIECEKEVAPYIYRAIRDRLKADGTKCLYLDGRNQQDIPPPPPGAGLVMAMIHQIREVVRGAVGERIIVLPHLDILATGMGMGTIGNEARELIPLMYENPEILWLGFKDPSIEMPKPIASLFSHNEQIIGVPRDRLKCLVTKREARKLGRKFDPYALYKYVSGVNAVKLRRLLGALTGEDYPLDTKPVYTELRQASVASDVEVPSVDIDTDIGGYGPVKDRLKSEILNMMSAIEKMSDPTQIKRIESLIPKGMIFWGPPGTGKSYFAKAMATVLGASIQIVSGPELKSKWVGEAEQNLRELFMRARKNAPSIIVFDELDSFATQRGTYTGSGVEHSMVNQLLTEMDGFRKEEMVFVVGTTNFVESLDAALMRPGRFEFALHIPYPNEEDRKAILNVHNKLLGAEMTDEAISYAAKRTGEPVPGPSGGMPYSGDHIQALVRQISRTRLREGKTTPTVQADVDVAIEQYLDKPKLDAGEEFTVATHESGHAIVALNCKHAPNVERISIRGDIGGALGYVKHSDPKQKYVTTYGQLRDQICILYGGREAECLMLNDLSIGAGSDVQHATHIARVLVEQFGEGGEDLGVANWKHDGNISEHALSRLDKAMGKILEEERLRAAKIIADNKVALMGLRDLLLEKKVLDVGDFGHLDSRNTETKTETKPETKTVDKADKPEKTKKGK
jgi:cell division protease FtsH